MNIRQMHLWTNMILLSFVIPRILIHSLKPIFLSSHASHEQFHGLGLKPCGNPGHHMAENVKVQIVLLLLRRGV